jgi:hypothetical protein
MLVLTAYYIEEEISRTPGCPVYRGATPHRFLFESTFV